MDVRVFRYFHEVVKQGNITKAAKELHITQPTLSRQIMDLEEEVGKPLFFRGKRKVTLTDAGHIYHKRVEEMIRLLDRAQKEVQFSDDEVAGVLTIGCVETEAANFLMEQIETFHHKFPLVQYEFYNGNSDDIKIRLDAGKLDFGILIEPVEAAKYDEFILDIKERWGVLMPVGHSLSTFKELSIDQVTDQPMILPSRNIVMEELESWLGLAHGRLNLFATHNLLSNTLPLVEKGLALCLVVEGAYTLRKNDGFIFRPLKPEKVSRHVVAWVKNREQSGLTNRFLSHLREKITKL